MVYTVYLLSAHSLWLKHLITDRGYDFIEVLRWFAERVDRWNITLIYLPTSDNIDRGISAMYSDISTLA